MHLFYQPDSQAGHLAEDDSHHALKTLRLRIGDLIFVTDGRGTRSQCQITKADPRRCSFRVVEQQHTPARSFLVRICVAPTKNIDRMEWFIEKAVELGIERISFFTGQHSERRVLKLERMEKIAVAAMKQSLQSWLPILDEAVPLSLLLPKIGEEQRFVAHLPEGAGVSHLFHQATINSTYAVLIGPEGDFAPAELEQVLSAGFKMVTLGTNRLRTETAALAACHTLNLLNA